MRVKDPEAIRRWRRHRHLSQEDLAYLCRCSQAAISLIERGEMRTLSEDLALNIARRLDVPWQDLFEQKHEIRMPSVTHGTRSMAQDGAA